MIRALRLLLPALIPSWAFFKAVEPSPRIEWRLLSDTSEPPPAWQEFRPRPARVSPLQILIRLFWNPRWNETLYLVSLAERLMIAPTTHSVEEIERCLTAEARRSTPISGRPNRLQFQILFVSRDQDVLTETVTYLSTPCAFEPDP